MQKFKIKNAIIGILAICTICFSCVQIASAIGGNRGISGSFWKLVNGVLKPQNSGWSVEVADINITGSVNPGPLNVVGNLSVSGNATTTGSHYASQFLLNNWLLSTSTTVCASGCNYDSIDTAVDTVTASSTILIKNGVYALGSGTITVAAGKTLEIIGESMDGVQITYSGSGNAFSIGASTEDTRRFRLENITIIGTSNGIRGLSLVRVKNSTFRNIRVYGFSSTANPGQAIRLDGTGSWTGDNYFYNLACDTSEICLNLAGTAVNSNHFFGFAFRPQKSGTDTAIRISNANGNTFSGGLVGNSTKAIRFLSSGNENQVSGVYCEDNTTCVVFDSGSIDNSVNVIDVETNTTLVSDEGTENNFSATGDNGFTYFNSGNVGINTTTPQTKLDIKGTMSLYPEGKATTTCSTINEGAFMYSTGTKGFYGCDGANWTQL